MGNPRNENPDPHPNARDVRLHPRLRAKGGTGNGTLTWSNRGRQGIATIIDDVSLSGEQLARTAESNHRLLFTTPKLTAPLHLSGLARIEIKLASSKPAANLSVWLVSLPWDESARRITSNLITRGWADPQNHASLTESAPLEPDKFYTLNFELQPDDQIIPAGQRLGLMIFSSDRDFTLWPEAGTELQVDLDETVLELPIVGGRSAYRKALSAGPL